MELYIHVPFCMKKCGYCDFLSMVSGEKDRQTYVDALCREIAYYGKIYGTEIMDTIYIGGGTPTVLGADALAKVLECVQKKFYVNPHAEVTIELNPATIDKSGLHKLREKGVNRLSIGLQSTDDAELKLLGRIHSYEDFLRIYHDARDVGFGNINVDLMSALPGQTVENYAKSLDKIVELQPEHISSYSLSLEEKTPFYRLYGGRPDLLPTEEEDREMYRLTKERLKAAGYERYEISNYARLGFESKHNSGYWKRIPYLGLGLGASSFINHARWKNVEDLKEYLQIWDGQAALEGASGRSATEEMERILPHRRCFSEWEELTLQDEMAEYMYLGLRMKEGITIKGFEDAFHKPFYEIYGDVVSKLMQDGLLAIDGGAGRSDEMCRNAGLAENEEATGNKEMAENEGMVQDARIYLTEFGIDVSNYVFEKFI